jgi:hypothetical protein
VEVGTNATGTRSTFAKKLARINTAMEEEIYGAANLTANKYVEFIVGLSDAKTEATSWSIADTDCIADQLKQEISGITSNEQSGCLRELSICLIEFEASWKAICIQELQKTIKQHVFNF